MSEITCLRLFRTTLPLVLVLLGGAAVAQQRPLRPGAPVAPAEPSAAAASTPDRTSAQYGDWTVTCIGPVNTTERACEMSQTFVDSSQQLIAAVAFGRPNGSAKFHMVLRVAPNVLVAQPARLTLDSETPLPFTLCTGQFCVMHMELPDNALSGKLRALAPEQPARLAWRNAAGNEVAVGISARGFGGAWDAMLRDGRQPARP